jgi:Alpha/beta hydrolase domain
VSQCGNFIKTFIHLGFNQDVDGKQVFDGVFAQIAARQTNLNMRFAVPGGGGGVRGDHTAFGQAGTRGLAADYVDDVSLRSDGGILKRCTTTSTCPKLFIGYSGSEFWSLQGSPLLTNAYGTADLVQPANARIYFYSSSHHLLGLPSLPANSNGAPFAVGNLYATNGNVGATSVVRALYQDLEDWVVAGTTPPDSQVPKIADATLVRPSAVAFPAIPGVAYTGLATLYPLLDWGGNYRAQDESGIATQLPPAYLGRDYAILVPQVDADGNDKAGIRSTDVAAGLGTNTGWNYTNKPGIVDLAGSPLAPGLVGSYFPYAKTQAQRLASGDPRLSLTERYGTQAGYVAAVTAAANDLVARRFMLQADATAAIAAATANVILP